LRRSTATRPSGNRGVEIPKNEHDSGENHTKKPSNTAWTADENERLRELIISNASVIDIAADLGRTVKAVRARAHALRIALGRSRFRVKEKAKAK
jgi:hypothetical protein